MKKQELNRLLEKYYKGTGTEEEESRLFAFFTGDDVPEGYEAEKVIFGFYRSASVIPEPSGDFESRIIESIDDFENRRISGKLVRRVLPLISVAAGILILAGTWFFFMQKKEFEDTFTDPRVAYNETLKILYNVSNQLNQAERVLEPVSEMINLPAKSLSPLNNSRKILGKSLENLVPLQDVNNETLSEQEHTNKK